MKAQWERFRQDGTLDETLAAWLWEQRCGDLTTEGGAWSERACAALVANGLAVRARYAACEAVFRQLEAARVPYAVVKGAVLSEAAYGKPAARLSADIDLLIDRKSCETVRAALLDEGFIQGYAEAGELRPYSRESLLYYGALSHQMAPFVKRLSSPFCPILNVDVNTDIFWGESSQRTDMAAFLDGVMETAIAGVLIKKLPPERELIALCLHHYKDMHSAFLLAQGSLRLSLFRDIACYITRQRPDTAVLAAEAVRFGAAPYVYVCLRHTRRLFPDEVPEELVAALQSDEGERLLGVYGLNEAEQRPWRFDFPDCLFDQAFPERFYASLDEEERRKVAVNRRVL